MREQHKSDTFRYGDTNKDHIKALRRTIQFWCDEAHPRYGNWIVDQSWVEHYDQKFIAENPDRNKDHFFHVPDIALFEYEEVIPRLRLVIELDGPSHDAKTRQISDKIFEKWIETKYEGTVKVIRINIRELVDLFCLAFQHLKQVLLEYII